MIMTTSRALLGAVAVLVWLSSSGAVADDTADAKLQEIVAGPQRASAAIARDPFRHPYEVLHFFGLAPGQTIVEILPGATGYWTEILALYLHDRGTYYAALGESERGSEEVRKANFAFAAKLAAAPRTYGKVI